MSAVLDIAIGVVFIFLSFSLVISGVHELLVAVTSLRAKVLWTVLKQFGDADHDRTTRLHLSSMLKLLRPRGSDPRPALEAKPASNTPGPPPPATPPDTPTRFVQAVLDQTMRFETGTKRSRLKHVSPAVVSRAVLELGGDTATLATANAADVTAFLAKIRGAVQGTQLERPVTAAIATASGDLQRFRADIETWFDTRMEALSSTYKVWTRWILLVLALVLAFVVDVNPIVSVDLLRKDAALAQATVDQATTFVKNENLTVSHCPAGTPQTTTTTTAATSTTADPVASCYQSVRDAIARTRTLPPPLAFNHLGPGEEAGWQYLLGSLLGGIALSFGAPFWFDVLRKLIAQRT